MGIFRVGGVEVFVDRNKADVADAEILLDVIAGVDGVPSQTGEVFDNHAVYMTGLNIREHLLKARTVEVCPGRAVVDIGQYRTKKAIPHKKAKRSQIMI